MRLVLLGALLVGCSAGYRDEDDSRDLRRDLDDRTLASHVRIAIGRDPETAEEAIEVYCDDGVVYLRGSVRRSAAADRAASIAAGIDGARKVVDRITRPSANG
ncbi:MAG: BON domain-containing protein [Planctomycetota bacterium]